MVSKKKGQFYLLAALIIILIIIGFAAVSNYSRTQKYTRTYDLADELEIESANVLDYGTYNENIDVDAMEGLLNGFIEEYSKIGDLEQLYFIFGNADDVSFMGYNELQANLSVEVGLGDGGESNVLELGKKKVGSKKFKRTSDVQEITVKLKYDGQVHEYHFELNSGENFYFILSQVIQGERYVVTNNEEN